jgi:hypothetical protein
MMICGRKWCASVLVVFCGLASAAYLCGEEYLSGKVWPEPKLVTPGDEGGPPSDAIVLFDGHDLSKFNGGEKWEIADGAATIHGGGVTSKQGFGSCQLHVEWAAPAEVKGSGQGRGNSGI